MKFSLKHGDFHEATRKSTCPECNRVFKLLVEMESAITSPSEKVRKIIPNVSNKLELYMGHKVRAKTQDERIKELIQWVMDGSPNKRFISFIDYKMKVEPERLRETQLQYYGKAGMSWHGSAVFYRVDKARDVQCSELQRKMKTKERWRKRMGMTGNGAENTEKGEQEEQLSMFFVDHIPTNDKKQDRMLTASIIEALCFRIRRVLSKAKEIVICSDNARNYNNNMIPIILPKMYESHGLRFSVYIHPDACCGKSCVDAHFAVSFRHLKRYISEKRFDVLTPDDIVDSLLYDNGVVNTYFDYIETDREHPSLLDYEISDECDLCDILDSPSEIIYRNIGEAKYELTCYKYSNCFYRKYVVQNFVCQELFECVPQNPIDKENDFADEMVKLQKEKEGKNWTKKEKAIGPSTLKGR